MGYVDYMSEVGRGDGRRTELEGVDGFGLDSIGGELLAGEFGCEGHGCG